MTWKADHAPYQGCELREIVGKSQYEYMMATIIWL